MAMLVVMNRHPKRQDVCYEKIGVTYMLRKIMYTTLKSIVYTIWRASVKRNKLYT